MAERLFTPDEANALVPRLRPLLAALRAAWHDHMFARAQVQELAAFGQADGDEARGWQARSEARRAEAASILDELHALGADVKDPILGLVDLPHRRADGSIALLCFRDDEERIAFWHPPETGFAGRRPLTEL